MAIIKVTPTQIRVRSGWFDGRPRSIRLADEEVPVTGIEGVREESAAYRAEQGPRTIFDVRTPDARLRLAFEHRRRRWLLEGMEATGELSKAA
jgi:hypothetical protein